MNQLIKPLRGGQITIPALFRDKLGIDQHSLLQLSIVGQELRIKPVTILSTAAGAPWFKKVYDQFAPVRQEAKKYSETQIDTAIDTAVKAVRKSHV